MLSMKCGFNPFMSVWEWRDNKAHSLLGRQKEGAVYTMICPFKRYFYDAVKPEINVIVI